MSDPTPPATIQRIEHVNTPPVPSGQLVTGAMLQIGGLEQLVRVTEIECKTVLNKAVAQNKRKLAAAQAALTKATEAYQKEVGTITVPADFLADAKKLTDGLVAFYPQAALKVVTATDAHGNPIPASHGVPKVEFALDPGAKTFTATVRVNLGSAGSSGDRQLYPARAYALPKNVLDALAKIDLAKEQVAQVESRLRDLRDEFPKLKERAEVSSAAVIREQMETIGGSKTMARMDLGKRQYLKDIGLDEDGNETA
jgi:hypothetical protein